MGLSEGASRVMSCHVGSGRSANGDRQTGRTYVAGTGNLPGKCFDVQHFVYFFYAPTPVSFCEFYEHDTVAAATAVARIYCM